MTDDFGTTKTWKYNSNDTLRNIVTRVTFHGAQNILAEKVSYTYTYYPCSTTEIKSATKTDVIYYTDPDDPNTFGKIENTIVTKELFDKSGNIITKPAATDSTLAEINQKLALASQIVSNNNAIPKTVSVVGSVVTKANAQNSLLPAKK